MKRFKIITGIAAAVVIAGSLAGCSGSGDTGTVAESTIEFEGESTVDTQVAAKDYNSFYKHIAKIYKKHVDLGEYKGIDVTKVDRSNENVTDEDVDSVIDLLKTEFTENEDLTEGGTTQEGDIIILDYSGTIDGEAFDGGTAENQSYTIGSGQFIEDLDKGLVGLNANTDYEIPVTFPNTYRTEELRGREAVFKVNISQILRSNEPEINDQWVKDHAVDLSNRGYGSSLKSLEDLKKGIKEALAISRKATNDGDILEEALKTIKENSTIKSYPKEELDALKERYIDNVESEYENMEEYASTLGIESYEDYLKQMYGMDDKSQLEELAQSQAEDYLASKMLVLLMAEENGLKASVEDINKVGNSLAARYNYSSYQALIDSYGSKLNCVSGYQVIYNKLAELMAELSNPVLEPTTEAAETDDTQTEGAESESVNTQDTESESAESENSESESSEAESTETEESESEASESSQSSQENEE